MEKPSSKPDNPNFSSGPCSKRPGWTIDALKNTPIGRSHRSKECKAKLKEVIDRSKKILNLPESYVIGIMPGDTPLANICDFPLTINVGINNRISKPLTSRIAYTAVIDVLTMGVAQLKPEAQDHLYNIADSQRSLKVDN